MLSFCFCAFAVINYTASYLATTSFMTYLFTFLLMQKLEVVWVLSQTFCLSSKFGLVSDQTFGLRVLFDSWSVTLTLSQSIAWFLLHTWSMMADLLVWWLLVILAARLFFSALVNAPGSVFHFFAMLFRSCQCPQWSSSFTDVDTFTVRARYLVSYATLWIRKNSSMNRDEGNSQLSHVWDSLLIDAWNWKSVMMKSADQRSKCWCKKFVTVFKIVMPIAV